MKATIFRIIILLDYLYIPTGISYNHMEQGVGVHRYVDKGH